MDGISVKLQALFLWAWLLSVSTVDGENFELVILHTNDVHARIEETNQYGGKCSKKETENGECFGGVARRKTAIDAERSNHSNVLLLDAGDQFQGTVWFNYYEGLEASHFMNMMQYNAMALGNHEFDNGVSGLAPFLENVSFPVLSCNLDSSREPILDGLYTRKEVVEVGGKRIAIVGYTTSEAAYLVDPEGIRNVSFRDPLVVLQTELDRLKNRADGPVDKVICLGHGGFPMDLRIAEEIEDVDVVIGGHTNSFLYTGHPPSVEVPEGEYPTVVTQRSGRRVPVVQAFAYGKYLGKLVLQFNESGEVTSWSGNPILLNSSVEPDPEVQREVEKWMEPIDEYRSKVIGSTLVYLEGDRKVCRMKECNLGNLITDGIISEHVNKGRTPSGHWTKSAIALWNAGAIRSSIPEGGVRRGQAVEVLPFRNEITRVLLSGEALLLVLENSVARYDFKAKDPPGGFLHMSGLKVIYNMSQPAGKRVLDAQALCTDCPVPAFHDVDAAANYSILTNDYLVRGGDNYTMFKKYMLDMEPIGLLGTDVLEDYIAHRSPLFPAVEARITYLDGNNTWWPLTTGHCTAETKCPQGVNAGVQPHLCWTVLLFMAVFYTVLREQ